MKVPLIAAVMGLVVISRGAWFVTSGASVGDIPPGVDPAFWHPLSDRLGLALRHERGMAGRMERTGTFMVKSENAWHPVHVEGPPRARPLQ